MAIYTFWANAVGLLVTFAFPYALAAIEWKTYMINGAWDVLELAFVLYFWVETKGKSLEEIDEVSFRLYNFSELTADFESFLMASNIAMLQTWRQS